jgi:translation initiation factor 2 subunit 1
MIYKKHGMPEESDIALCTVTSIQGPCVFAKLDEFDHKSGMIHISEVSPGRIRNIRDYVKEGKVIVCKILKIDNQRGHIDLSLRRVSDSQRRNKVNALKLEQKAEKIIESIAKEMKTTLEKLYAQITPKIFQEYEYVYECFEEVSVDGANLSSFGIEKDVCDKLTTLIKERIKPPEIVVEGYLKVICYDADGVDKIKNALVAGEAADETCEIRYHGAGKYHVMVKDTDYKLAEGRIAKVLSAVEKAVKKFDATVEFDRKEN